MRKTPPTLPLLKRLANRILRRLERPENVEWYLGFKLVSHPVEREHMKRGLDRLREVEPRLFRRLRLQFDQISETVEEGWTLRRVDLRLLPAPRGETEVAADLAWNATAAAAMSRLGAGHEAEVLASRLALRAWLRVAVFSARREKDPARWHEWAGREAAAMHRGIDAPPTPRLERAREVFGLLRERFRLLEQRERKS